MTIFFILCILRTLHITNKFLGPNQFVIERGDCSQNVFSTFLPNANCYRKHLLLHQGHKVRTWVMPQGQYSVITCRIDLKLDGNVSPDLAEKIHFVSWAYDHPWGITQVRASCPWGTK